MLCVAAERHFDFSFSLPNRMGRNHFFFLFLSIPSFCISGVSVMMMAEGGFIQQCRLFYFERGGRFNHDHHHLHHRQRSSWGRGGAGKRNKSHQSIMKGAQVLRPTVGKRGLFFFSSIFTQLGLDWE